MPDTLSRALRHVINAALLNMQRLDEVDVAQQRADRSWSRKQELGHLIDSATNNHVRFAVAALQGHYVGPKYDQNGWVDLHGYSEMDWTYLVDSWYSANLLLARLVDRIPEQRLAAQCRIGTEEASPVTLRFLIQDYIDHMQCHLNKILPHAATDAIPEAG